MLDTSMKELLQAVAIKANKGLSFGVVISDIRDSYDVDWKELKDSCPEFVQDIRDTWRRNYVH